MEHVEACGVRIAFERSGSGPPLLLLHGAMSDHREWAEVSRRLDADVIAWDAPGFGASPPPPSGWGLGEYADCAVAFARALGLHRPHVGGLSFGGGLALEICRRHPRLPATLILLSAYAGWAGSLSSGEVDDRLEATLATAPPPWLETLARSFAAADLRDALPEMTPPALVLAGAGDPRAPLPVAEALARAIPQAELVVIEAAGHELNTEAPERVAAEIDRFLRAGQAA